MIRELVALKKFITQKSLLEAFLIADLLKYNEVTESLTKSFGRPSETDSYIKSFRQKNGV